MNENKQEKIEDKKYTLIKSNIIRIWMNAIYDFFQLEKYKCYYYGFVHDLFIFLIAFIIIFNTNVMHLVVLLLVVSLDAFSIIVMHKCPLTLLEKKYLKSSSSERRKDFLQKLGISYQCNHEYENQIELLINVWMIVASKCIILVFLNTFQWKLSNTYQLYI